MFFRRRCFLPESTFAVRRTLSRMRLMPKPFATEEHTRRCCVSTVTCIHVDTRLVAGRGDAAKCRSASGTYISAETRYTGITTLPLRLPTASRQRLHLCYPMSRFGPPNQAHCSIVASPGRQRLRTVVLHYGDFLSPIFCRTSATTIRVQVRAKRCVGKKMMECPVLDSRSFAVPNAFCTTETHTGKLTHPARQKGVFSFQCSVSRVARLKGVCRRRRKPMSACGIAGTRCTVATALPHRLPVLLPCTTSWPFVIRPER